MTTKLVKVKSITKENFADVNIFDIQSATIYDSATEFFQNNENAKACFSMIANLDYTAERILNCTAEEQRTIKYQLMIDALHQLISDCFIICYDDVEVLD